MNNLEISIRQYGIMLEDDVRNVNRACESLQLAYSPKYSVILSNIRLYPKCAIRSAMQVCDCDHECVSKIFDKLEWSRSCYIYDFENIWNIEEFIDCNGATHRPNNGELRNYYFGNNIELTKEKLNLLISELTKEKLNSLISEFTNPFLKKLECAAYELRDECNNEKDCYGEINYTLVKKCENTDMESQLKTIFKILYDTPSRFSEEKDFINERKVTKEKLKSYEKSIGQNSFWIKTREVNESKNFQADINNNLRIKTQEVNGSKNLQADNNNNLGFKTQEVNGSKNFQADININLRLLSAGALILVLWPIFSYLFYKSRFVKNKLAAVIIIALGILGIGLFIGLEVY